MAIILTEFSNARCQWDEWYIYFSVKIAEIIAFVHDPCFDTQESDCFSLQHFIAELMNKMELWLSQSVIFSFFFVILLWMIYLSLPPFTCYASLHVESILFEESTRRGWQSFTRSTSYIWWHKKSQVLDALHKWVNAFVSSPACRFLPVILSWMCSTVFHDNKSNFSRFS